MTKTITVKPVPGGWAVDAAGGEAPLMFLGGGRAEQKARELAERFARGGQNAEVAIHDLGGRLVGQVRYEADSVEA
jgi:hypothetical protein